MTIDSSNLFTSDNLESASDIARNKIRELRHSVKTGDWSLRLLALIGGVALIFTSVLELVSKILNFNVLGALIEIYVILLGVIIIVLEGSQISLPKRWLLQLHKYALFLKFIWGKQRFVRSFVRSFVIEICAFFSTLGAFLVRKFNRFDLRQPRTYSMKHEMFNRHAKKL